MTYFDKVKASKEVYNAICAMEGDDEIVIQYGQKRDYKMVDGKHKTIWNDCYYMVRCHSYGQTKSYHISEKDSFLGRSMNVDKVSKTTLSLYSYDLMDQKTTYRLPLYKARLA